MKKIKEKYLELLYKTGMYADDVHRIIMVLFFAGFLIFLFAIL